MADPELTAAHDSIGEGANPHHGVASPTDSFGITGGGDGDLGACVSAQARPLDVANAHHPEETDTIVQRDDDIQQDGGDVAACASVDDNSAPVTTAPFSSFAELPVVEAAKKKKPKKKVASTGNNSNQDESDKVQDPPREKKKHKKKHKNKSPNTDTPDIDAVEVAIGHVSAYTAENDNKNGNENDNGNENGNENENPTTPTDNNSEEQDRPRGFTAVNSVYLPVASVKPPHHDPSAEQIAQSLNELTATPNSPPLERDADAEGDAATTGKKHKRKRHKTPATDEVDQDPATSQSAKKHKGKNCAVDAVNLLETQVSSLSADDTNPVRSEIVDGGGEEGSVLLEKQKNEKEVNTSASENIGQEAENLEAEVVPETQPRQAEQHEENEEQLPSHEDNLLPLHSSAPLPPPQILPTTTTGITSSPNIKHTPKPKSKVAIAYERKRKRLEAAAAAASPAVAHVTGDDDGMELDIPPEEDDDAPDLPARETPKSTKRRKRRLPDLNTPSSSIYAYEGGWFNSDDERGGDYIGQRDADGNTTGFSHTPQHRSIARKPKTPRSSLIAPATPQPGTTASSRKRASYTYAPDPVPDTPPSTGTFTLPECTTIDNYLQGFATANSLTEKQLIARIWGDTSVVPTQTKLERESFWKELYELFPHRKRLAIYNHVRRRYHNFDVQGAKWGDVHDAELARMVEEQGKKWTFIGRAMGRLPDDCRDRWRNYVKCGQGRREKEWTEEEEAQLRSVVAEVRESLRKAAEDRGEAIGGEGEPNWTVVSEKMGGWRSRIQCRYKWSKLLELGSQSIDGAERRPRIKTPRKRGPRKSTMAKEETHPPEDDVPIDPALAAEFSTMATAPPITDASTTSAFKRPRIKKFTTFKTTKLPKSKSKKVDEAAAIPGAYEDSDTITPLASQQMLTGDKIWLLESILEYNPTAPGAIPWDELSGRSGHSHWTARGLERAFGRIVKKGISRREREGLGVVEGVQRLLGELSELPESVRRERWSSPSLVEEEEEDEEGASIKGKGKSKAKGRGKKSKNTGTQSQGDEADEAEEGDEAHLRDAVKMALDHIKEREETEKLARVLLSSVQEAYGN